MNRSTLYSRISKSLILPNNRFGLRPSDAFITVRVQRLLRQTHGCDDEHLPSVDDRLQHGRASIGRLEQADVWISVGDLNGLGQTSFAGFFRGTLLGLVVLSCLSLPAVATLQPVERHLRKTQKTKSVSIDMSLQSPQEPLMPLGGSLKSLQQHQGRRRMSMLSLGDRVASVMSIHQDPSKEANFW